MARFGPQTRSRSRRPAGAGRRVDSGTRSADREIEESGGRGQPEYVFAALMSGQQSLWIITTDNDIVAAFTTELASYPELRTTVVHFLGGNGLGAWYPSMSKAVTEYARSCGCDAIECTARMGFWPWFKDDGFERKSVFYEKKL